MNLVLYSLGFSISFVIFFGSVFYFVGNLKKGRTDGTQTTIQLMKDEIEALKQRLDTTSSTIIQLNATLTTQTQQISELQADNQFLKSLIKDALQLYFKENNSNISTIQKKL